MRQILEIILWQLYYSKTSFIVKLPGHTFDKAWFSIGTFGLLDLHHNFVGFLSKF